jgi:hypothetical protein
MVETAERNDREARAGRNQSLFREVNERMRETTDSLRSQVWPESFLCECGHDTCFEPVRISKAEYESVRKNPRWFFVAPSDEHFIPDAEVLVDRQDRFWVVEKIGDDAAVAVKTDSRSRARRRKLEFHPADAA